MSSHIIQLADLFASAAFGGVRWLDALRALADATRSSRGELIGIGNDDAMHFNWINDFSEDQVAAFHAATTPTTNARIAASILDPALVLRSERDYDAAMARFPDQTYRELVHHYGIPNGCQAKLLADENSFVGMAVLRTEADGHTAPEDRAIFAEVMPHVRSAVRT